MNTPSAFGVLWRTFLAQFFASESVTSDIQMRRTIIWVLAFLLTPCLYLMAAILPTYEIVRLVAAARNAPEMIENILAKLAAIFVGYSMVTVGMITVFVWDALVFDKRDAMVIGPLPLRGLTVIAAKLAALATFMLGASLAINLTAGLPYAFVTGGNDGLSAMLRHLAGHLSGTMGGAIFVFAAIVALRGLILLAGGARFAAPIGSMLQFLFVSAVFFAVEGLPTFRDSRAGEWIPVNWYFGLFERLRGSTKPELIVLSQRAMIALPIAMCCAAVVTFAGYRRQMRAALAPPASAGALGTARMRRALARALVGHDGVARATADFILTTIARNRQQQAPIAISAAIAVVIVNMAIERRYAGIESLMVPRPVVLWIPIVVGYWMAIGLRASFFVPSELSAAWSFAANAPENQRSYWAGVRASMIAFVIGPALLINAVVLVPLLGWRIAAWHAPVVCALLIVTIEIICLTINGIPFTRAYPPGHAKLRTRWPLYLIGMYAVGYWPTRLEVQLLDSPIRMMSMIGCVIAAIAMLEIAGRRAGMAWSVQPEESVEDPDAATVLNIGPVAPAGGRLS